jgi:hypothetical protein
MFRTRAHSNSATVASCRGANQGATGGRRRATQGDTPGLFVQPRELRHTFVPLLSAHGAPVEAIALLAGHN